MCYPRNRRFPYTEHESRMFLRTSDHQQLKDGHFIKFGKRLPCVMLRAPMNVPVPLAIVSVLLRGRPPEIFRSVVVTDAVVVGNLMIGTGLITNEGSTNKLMNLLVCSGRRQADNAISVAVNVPSQKSFTMADMAETAHLVLSKANDRAPFFGYDQVSHLRVSSAFMVRRHPPSHRGMSPIKIPCGWTASNWRLVANEALAAYRRGRG